MVFKATSWRLHYSSPNVRQNRAWMNFWRSAQSRNWHTRCPCAKHSAHSFHLLYESLKGLPDCDKSETGTCNPSESQQLISPDLVEPKTQYIYGEISCVLLPILSCPSLLADMWQTLYLFSIAQWMMINEKKMTGLIKPFILTMHWYFSCKLRDLFSPKHIFSNKDRYVWPCKWW